MSHTLSDTGGTQQLAAVEGQRVAATFRSGAWPGLPKKRWVELVPHRMLVFKSPNPGGSAFGGVVGRVPCKVFLLHRPHVTVSALDARSRANFPQPTFVANGLFCVEQSQQQQSPRGKEGAGRGGKRGAGADGGDGGSDGGGGKLYPHPVYIHGDERWQLALVQAASAAEAAVAAGGGGGGGGGGALAPPALNGSSSAGPSRPASSLSSPSLSSSLSSSSL